MIGIITELILCFLHYWRCTSVVSCEWVLQWPKASLSSTLVVICVVWLLFVLFYVLFVCKCVLPPDDNPIAVNKYVNIISSSSSSPWTAVWMRFMDTWLTLQNTPVLRKDFCFCMRWITWVSQFYSNFLQFMLYYQVLFADVMKHLLQVQRYR